MKGLHYRTLISVLALLMLAAPTAFLVRRDLGLRRLAQREVTGLGSARDALRLVRLLQEHRGLTNLVLTGNDVAKAQQSRTAAEIARLFARTATSLQRLRDGQLANQIHGLLRQWTVLSKEIDRGKIDAPAGFRQHTVLIDEMLSLVERINDAAQIGAHENPRDRHLGEAAMRVLPRLTESLGKLRGEGAPLLARTFVSKAQRTRFAEREGTARSLASSARRTLDLAMHAAPGSYGRLIAARSQAKDALHQALELIQHAILSGNSARIAPNAYFTKMSRAIDAQFRLIDVCIGMLRSDTERSSTLASRRVFLTLAIAFSLALFGLWLITLVDRAQQSQHESDARGRAILDAAPDAVLIADPAGMIQLTNRAASRLYGYGSHTLCGMMLTDLVSADCRASFESQVMRQTCVHGEPTHLEGELLGLRKGGNTFPAEISCSAIQSSDTDQRILVVRDVTERRRLEQQLRQSQKMDAIGQLTGGIAHDFNNLLAIIVGSLDLLEQRVAADVVAANRISAAQKAALRGADLTRRLLAFSRKQHLQPKPVHLKSVVADFLAMATRTLGPEIKIVSNIPDDLPSILADESALESALLNLAVNARDAMPGGGTLSFVASVAELEGDDPIVRANDLRPGQFVNLRVSDTGQGIPRERLEKVFEPFFTTKDSGTGLGLAMVYGFVKQTGGAVKIYSEMGTGTTVAILLPVGLHNVAQPCPNRKNALHHRAPAGATALVVDDEVDLRDIAASYLKEFGYRVLTAPDGPSALQVLSSESHIDLVVTDVIMPGGMNGVALVKKVLKRMPHVKVVFTSGFPSQALAERDGTAVDGPLLNKPFVRREFTAVVAGVMEGVVS